MQIALLAYLIYVLIVFAANTAVIYHFTKYSFPGDATKSIVFFYTIVMIAIPVLTLSIVGVISL